MAQVVEEVEVMEDHLWMTLIDFSYYWYTRVMSLYREKSLFFAFAVDVFDAENDAGDYNISLMAHWQLQRLWFLNSDVLLALNSNLHFQVL